MAETHATTDTVIDAALALAARRPWQEVGLADIAAEAGLDLAGLRQVAASKAHILALFSRRIDTLLLKALKSETLEGEAHDRLFDVIMRRLDILQPWRAAVKSILAAGPGDPVAMASAGLNAMDDQRWVMAAAGVDLPRDGMAQAVRLAGLALVQHRVLRVWAEDDDPGLARSMAALDRQLRDGATWLKRLDAPMALCAGMARVLGALARGAPAAPASPAAPQHPAEDPKEGQP